MTMQSGGTPNSTNKEDKKSLLRFVPLIILLISLTFNFFRLLPEITHITPTMNDNIYHYGLLVRMNDAFSSGENFWDCWVPYWVMGYPVFHYYQGLPYLIIIIIYNIFGQAIDLFTIFRGIQFFLLVFFPLPVYYGMRKLGFSPVEAAFSAATASLISTKNHYGWEWESHAWLGFGMYAQLISLFFFPLSLGVIYEIMEKQKKYFPAVLLLSLNFLLHFFFGYLLVILSFILIFTVPRKNIILTRFKKFFITGFLSFLVIMHILIPFLLDRAYHGHTVYNSLWKVNSYGAEWIIKKFLNGELLDKLGFPVLTILVIAGLLVALSRNKNQYRITWVIFLVTSIFYFGRTTWGGLIDIILPMAGSLHLHRFINAFDLGCVMAMGVALAYLWDKIDYKKSRLRLILTIILTVIILMPSYCNRYYYGRSSLNYLKKAEKEFAKDYPDFQSVIEEIDDRNLTRLYPGRKGNWGKDFRVGKVRAYSLMPPEKISCLSNLPFGWSISGDFQCYFKKSRYFHYRLFNVKYVLAPPEKTFPDFAVKIKETEKYILWQIDGFTYFDLVDAPILVKGDNENFWNLNLLWLKSKFVDKGLHLAIDFEGDLSPEDFDRTLVMKDRVTFIENGKEKNVFASDVFSKDYPEEPERGEILSSSSNGFYYEADVNIKRPCYLLFKMSYHPNWRVTVDKKPSEKIQMSPSFTGVKMEEGRHIVRLCYRPRKLKTILLITGLISLLLLFLMEYVAPRIKLAIKKHTLSIK